MVLFCDAANIAFCAAEFPAEATWELAIIAGAAAIVGVGWV